VTDTAASTPGTVHASAGGVYEVCLEDGRRVEASLRGRVKKRTDPTGRVVIGDRVIVSSVGDAWTIDDVEPRKTQLIRRGRGGRAPKVLAANLDRVFVVVALEAPRASTELVDRLLVLVESSGIHPILVLNKIDEAGSEVRADELRPLYGGIGFRVLVTSARSGEGLDLLRRELSSGVSALIGPSGVGKSSLLNALDPGLALRTSALSGKTGTGRHTTVASRLIESAPGGLVADTPGFGDVTLWAVPAEELASYFPDFGAHLGRCRFSTCTHMHEPNCAVRDAVERGVIAASRYRSYRTLWEEATAG
jgi:ribosome biogenesis GTPase